MKKQLKLILTTAMAFSLAGATFAADPVSIGAILSLTGLQLRSETSRSTASSWQ